MPSQFQINPWGSNQSYQQYDVIDGLYIGVTTHPTSAAHYATQSNVGQNPSGLFVYNITSISSAEDIATVYYAQTGNVPSVAPGSIVMVAGTASYNYTGMAIDGGSGWLKFINPGFADTIGAAGTVSMRNPAWTTGFFFVPSYPTKIPTKNDTIETKMGGGYSQRMSQGLNTFEQDPVFVYQGVDKRMTKAIAHYVQTNEGVWPTEVLMPDQYLNNQPHQKFTLKSVDVDPASFGRYNVAVQLSRVFDI